MSCARKPLLPVHGSPKYQHLLVLVDGALRGLGQFLTLATTHVSSQLDEDGLHCVLALPVGQAGQLRRVDDAVARIDAGEVHHADELDRGRLIGVLVTAVHLDRVDSVLVHTLFPKESVSYHDVSVLC